MAAAIAAYAVTGVLRFGGGVGLHRCLEEGGVGAGSAILAPFAADRLLDVAVADRRRSAATVSANYVSAAQTIPGDRCQAHLADHIDDGTAGEIVFKRDPLQIRCHLRPLREPLAPEPQSLFSPRRREVHHRLETSHEGIVEIVVHVCGQDDHPIKVSIRCSR